MSKWTRDRLRAAIAAFRDFDYPRRQKALIAIKALPDAETDAERRDREILRSYAMGAALSAIADEYNYGETTINKHINRYTDRVQKGILRQ